MILVCFIGCSITKIYNILFSTFWLLFICSFIPEDVADNEEAKNIYANVMMISVVLGLCLAPVIGKLTDRISP